MSNQEHKIVNWRIHDVKNNLFKIPNDRASSKVVTCAMSHRCQAYAMGKCATFGFMRGSCSYARFDRRQGYTRRARGYQKWINSERERVDGIDQLGTVDHICEIGDFIYFPYRCWTKDKSIECDKREGWASRGDVMIPKSRFTPDYFEQIVNASINHRDGGYDYHKEVQPKMIADVKKYAPGFYKAWADKFPQSAKAYAVTYVGRRARIKTIAPCEWTDKKGVHYKWDGKAVTVTNDSVSFSKVIGETVQYVIKPSDKATMIVTCDSQVNEDTVIE